MNGLDRARRRYMRAAGALQVAWALFAFFCGDRLIAWFIHVAGPSMALFPTGLGVFVGTFGVLSWMAASAPPGPALRAVLACLAGYLVCTLVADAWWVLHGVLTPWIWASIAMRGAVAAGYALFLRGSGMERSTG
ncbi:MAG: hypothetical protein JST66_06530 [Bacteroidetes bacterium]|nr:hypothetical protein [Bacteroidota bacterium]